MRLLALLLLLLPPQDEELLRRLEDDRVEIREQAQKELVARGAAALPRLRELLADPKTAPELRLRAGAAVRDIELALQAGAILGGTKLLTLKAADTMIAEVLDEIVRQSGTPIDRSAIDGAATVRLDVRDAPLFRVLDLLCAGRPDRTWEATDAGIVFRRERHAATPAHHDGPFRVRILRSQVERSDDFKERLATLHLTMDADVERRLKPLIPVDLDFTRVRDDRDTILQPQGADLVFGNAPGVRIAINGKFGPQARDSGRLFSWSGLSPEASTVRLDGVARYVFPLEARDIVFVSPNDQDARDAGDSTITLQAMPARNLWVFSFRKASPEGEASWAATLGQRLDRDSLSAVDVDGTVYPGKLIPMTGSGRRLTPGDAVSPAFQAQFTVPPRERLKELRFRFRDQVVAKSVPFTMTLTLP